MTLDWSYACGFYRAQVGSVGGLVVGWVDGAYRVSAFGVRLAEPSSDPIDGKRRAVDLARKLLAEASTQLSP